MKPIVRNITAALIIAGILAFTGFTLLGNKKEVEAKVYRKDPTLKVLVKTTTVEEKELENSLQLLGTFAPMQATDIISLASGKVESLGAEKGQWVKAGALIARLDDNLLQAQMIAARASYEKARADVDRYERIVAGNAMPKINLEGAQLTLKSAQSQMQVLEEQLSQTIIRAPFSGILTEKRVEIGTVVAPGTPIGKLIDISSLKLQVNVPENQINSVKPGQQLQIRTALYPTHAFTGKVITIGSQADAAHTYEVEVLVENSSSHPLKAGMYGQLVIENSAGSPTLAIPRTALIGSEKDPAVYVVENGIARLRKITTGSKSGDFLSVLSGLKTGEQVVINGQTNLTDSTAVALAR